MLSPVATPADFQLSSTDRIGQEKQNYPICSVKGLNSSKTRRISTTEFRNYVFKNQNSEVSAVYTKLTFRAHNGMHTVYYS